ncbi:MAG: hypothetical protein KA244_09710, partial [Deltaproteobacteria bacterium]|nr:hypothetical protein [Deltaproteobacteria bacterium]
MKRSYKPSLFQKASAAQSDLAAPVAAGLPPKMASQSFSARSSKVLGLRRLSVPAGMLALWALGTSACSQQQASQADTRLLTVVRLGSGAGVVTSAPSGIDCGAQCAAALAPSAQVTLTATAGAESVFLGWGGACKGTDVTCAVSLQDAVEVTARFEYNPVTVTVEKSGTGTGTIVSEPAGIDCGSTCSALFGQRVPLTLSAITDHKSTFVGWSGACADRGSSGDCTLSLFDKATVGAAFAPAICSPDNFCAENPLPQGEALGAVWGASATDVWTAGAGGLMLHNQGGLWTAVPSGTTQPLTGLWGSSATDIWAVGGAGAIVHYDGTAWTASTSGTTKRLVHVYGIDA